MTIQVGGTWGFVDFLFTPKADGNTPQLYAILVGFDVDNFAGLEKAMIAKYGQPTQQDTSDVHNGLGATFDNRVDTWLFKNASIELKKRSNSVRNSSLTYNSLSLSADIQKLLDAKTKTDAGGL